MAETGTLATVV